MYITIFKHVQTIYKHTPTIYKHFAVVLLNLFRQQYRQKNIFQYILYLISYHIIYYIYNIIYNIIYIYIYIYILARPIFPLGIYLLEIISRPYQKDDDDNDDEQLHQLFQSRVDDGLNETRSTTREDSESLPACGDYGFFVLT